MHTCNFTGESFRNLCWRFFLDCFAFHYFGRTGVTFFSCGRVSNNHNLVKHLSIRFELNLHTRSSFNINIGITNVSNKKVIFSCREFDSKITINVSNSTNTFRTFYTDSSTNHRFAVFIDYSTGDGFILCQHSAKREHKCREQKNKFSHRILLLFSDLLLLVLNLSDLPVNSKYYSQKALIHSCNL